MTRKHRPGRTFYCILEPGELKPIEPVQFWGVSRIAMPDYLEAQRDLNRLYRNIMGNLGVGLRPILWLQKPKPLD